MPELPEVELGRLTAERVALGRRVVRAIPAEDSIVFQDVAPCTVAKALRGRTVEAVCRRGKQLWFELDHAPHPLFHFGMSGAFHSRGTRALQLKSGPRTGGAEWPPRFAKLSLRFDDGGELVMSDARRFGRIALRDEPTAEPPISRLGFDALLDPPPFDRFAAGLRTRSATLKSVLLDQSFVAGLGNWLVDEIAYQAGLDPRRPVAELGEVEARRLLRTLKRIVARAVALDADDTRYPRTWLFHHRWGRKADARTARGETIEFIEVGGRTTAWVPARQR